MKTVSINNICKVLSPLGLYSLDIDGLTTSELSAYDVGFKIVEDKFNQLMELVFLSPKTLDSVEKQEKLLGIYSASGASLSERSQFVSKRYQDIFGGSSTGSGMLKLIRACGINGSLTENLKTKHLTLKVGEFDTPGITPEQAVYYVSRIMPAHCSWVVDYGTLTFDTMDSKGFSWADYDNLNISWNTFEDKGEDIYA